MNTTETKPSETPAALLNGGERVEVTTVDGATFQVLVTQLPVRLWEQAIGMAFDQSALLDLVCNKDPGWHQNLTPKSFGAVSAACRRQNEDFFAHASAKVEMMGRIPGFLDRLMKHASLTGSRAGSSVS